MLPAVLVVKVLIVGTVLSLILSKLEAVALLKLVIVPEVVKLTIPLALLVIPAIVPEPPRLIVPVLVRFAKTVVIFPDPVTAKVPELERVVIEQEPPRFKVFALDKAPAPESAVLTVVVPLLVVSPEPLMERVS